MNEHYDTSESYVKMMSKFVKYLEELMVTFFRRIFPK